MSNGTSASGENLMLCGLVLAIIVILNRIPVVWLRSSAIISALAAGYALAGALGRLDFGGVGDGDVCPPRPHGPIWPTCVQRMM